MVVLNSKDISSFWNWWICFKKKFLVGNYLRFINMILVWNVDWLMNKTSLLNPLLRIDKLLWIRFPYLSSLRRIYYYYFFFFGFARMWERRPSDDIIFIFLYSNTEKFVVSSLNMYRLDAQKEFPLLIHPKEEKIKQ